MKRKIVSILLFAGVAAVLLATPALAAGTPYGSGAYSSSTYNGETSGTSGGAPNTGAGAYTPSHGGSGTNKTSYNWVELAGGVVLIGFGIGIFVWTLSKHKHQEDQPIK